MNTKYLEYFVAVAETENVTKAADKLFLSQPALSKTLRILEEEVGYPLFDHNGKKIVLNTYGSIYLKYARKILHMLDDAQKELADAHSEQNSTVHIEIRAGAQYFVSLLSEFKLQNPYIKYRIYSPGSKTSDGKEPELTIFATEEEEYNQCSIILYKESLSLAVPCTHPLCKKESVTIHDLQNESFLTLSKGSSMRTSFDRYFGNFNLQPSIAYESENFSLLKTMVANGMGLCLVPTFSWKDVQNLNRCRLIPLKDMHVYRYVRIGWDCKRYLSDACRDTLDYLSSIHKYDIYE